MSSSFGGDPGAAGAAAWGPRWQRRSGCGASWTATELVAMVLGFMVYWPIGLAILGWKLLQRRQGSGESWRDTLRAAFASGAAFRAEAWPQSGNSAFDAWRRAEIERLEAERRKLEEAQRDFAAFVEEARRARDQEEFERFMARHPRT